MNRKPPSAANPFLRRHHRARDRHLLVPAHEAIPPRRGNSPTESAPCTSASFNQDKHHSSSEATRSTSDGIASSITVTFEIAGAPDTAALEGALLLLVRRHEVLRSRFRRLAGDLNCTALAPDSIALEAEVVGHFHSGDDLHIHLDKTFKSIDTLSWPLFLMGAVVREDGATVYLCFDHIVCDGLSMPVVVNELQTSYAALSAGATPELPPAASYLTFADDQRRRYAALGPDDDRLRYWKDFIRGNGGLFPRFPFDLGVPEGDLYPLVNRAFPLLDPHRTEALAAGARASGGSVSTAVLAAAATAQHRFGGPGVYRGLLPISERTDEGRNGGTAPNPWQHSVGWFVNTMPISSGWVRAARTTPPPSRGPARRTASCSGTPTSPSCGRGSCWPRRASRCTTGRTR
ncbi:condensation domain-containing protein [Streptomyces sp. NPDC013978]|uniref:condensation domain-containing protein n=1 Tax=Streptomyces sp. NPDC013978 TaxID=3364869 RepID=UPI0036FE1C59